MSAPSPVVSTVTEQVRACAPDDVGLSYTDDAPEWMKVACASYFARFDAPRDGNACGCGHTLGGFFGSFTWGLCHGEGFCAECGRPARGYHRILDPEGEPFVSLAHVLLYRAVSPESSSDGTGNG